MAKIITPLDAHSLMNAIVQQATGQTSLASVDLSTFVSCGETVLNTGIENTLNALTIVFGRTIVSARPYNAKIALIQETDTGLYKTRLRKISFYDKGTKESGWVNTNSHTKNLYNGYDNGVNGGDSVGSQWEQDKPVCIEFHFGGMEVYDFEITFYEDALKQAFTSPEEFANFWNGYLVAKQNEIESAKEAKNRSTLLNYIGGLYDMNMRVDLVAGFNTKFGTSYTGQQLRTTYLKEFLAYMVSEIKKYAKRFTERNTNYHWSPSITRDGVTYTDIVRHTPMVDQKLFLYDELFIDAESMVLPEIFHDGLLKIENYEGVSYWQSNKDGARSSVSVTPAIPDVNDPKEQTAGTPVALDYVVGVLFDRDACVTCFEFDRTDTTELEKRKLYRNTWIKTAFQSINDFTEQGVLFYMST